jgi:type II secretory pathway pseudopilin PulG
MLGHSDTVSEQIALSKQSRFSLSFWIAIAGIVLLGVVLFFPRPYCIIDKARRIDLEMAQIHQALDSYRSTFGAFPAGESRAVFSALRGQNPQKLVFYQCRAESVSQDGLLLDPWGTPYKVYFSGDEVLVRSAGPNKQFDDSSAKHFDDYIR